jgi:hypothetical protein
MFASSTLKSVMKLLDLNSIIDVKLFFDSFSKISFPIYYYFIRVRMRWVYSLSRRENNFKPHKLKANGQYLLEHWQFTIKIQTPPPVVQTSNNSDVFFCLLIIHIQFKITQITIERKKFDYYSYRRNSSNSNAAPKLQLSFQAC